MQILLTRRRQSTRAHLVAAMLTSWVLFAPALCGVGACGQEQGPAASVGLGQAESDAAAAEFTDLEVAAPGTVSPTEVSDAKRLHVLFVVGLPGTPSHTTLHRQIATTWYRWLQETVGVPAENMFVCSSRSGEGKANQASGESPESAPGSKTETQTESAPRSPSGPQRFGNDRTAIVAAIQELNAAAASDDDAVWVVLLGHGSFDGHDGFLHLPGPDLAAREYASLLANLTAPQQFISCTMSCSGHFLEHLARPGRIVVTATTADAEPNETEFPQAWAAVMKQTRAADAHELDLDGDRCLSILEMLVATSRRVARGYEADNRAATEHALLDDDGDGRGTEVESWEKLLAARASTIAVVGLPTDQPEAAREAALDAADSGAAASGGETANADVSDGQLAAQWRLLRLPAAQNHAPEQTGTPRETAAPASDPSRLNNANLDSANSDSADANGADSDNTGSNTADSNTTDANNTTAVE